MAKRGKSPRAQVPLRIPEALRARLEKAAKAGNKSMNAAILERLEASFHMENRFGGPRATALVEAIGHGLMAGGECSGSFVFGKLGHFREWLDFQIPFDRAAKVAMTILELNRPAVDGTPPTRTAAEAIGRTGAEAVEQSAAEVERQAQRAAAEAPTPTTAGGFSSVEAADLWGRAHRRVAVEHGLTSADDASSPAELREKIQRAYAELGRLLAAQESSDQEEGK